MLDDSFGNYPIFLRFSAEVQHIFHA